MLKAACSKGFRHFDLRPKKEKTSKIDFTLYLIKMKRFHSKKDEAALLFPQYFPDLKMRKNKDRR